MRAAIQKKSKNMSRVHQTLVEGLLADARPVSPIHSAVSQWGLWLTASLLIMGLALALVQVQPGLFSTMSQMPSLTFVLLAFGGSGAGRLGRRRRPACRAARRAGTSRSFSLLVLLALFRQCPSFSSTPNDHGFNPMQTLRQELGGALPWCRWWVCRLGFFWLGWSRATRLLSPLGPVPGPAAPRPFF